MLASARASVRAVASRHPICSLTLVTGIGTSLTNDFAAVSSPSPEADVDSLAGQDDSAPRSKALNIVLKLHSIEGRACVKISDELSKNSGDPSEVA